MTTLIEKSPSELKVEATVRLLPLPRGVTLKSVFFDSDHTGDPAIRVVYAVSKKIPLTATRVRELVSLSNSTSREIENLRLERFPYVTFEDAR